MFKRFNVESKGHAHWFLGMRIHQYKDGSHTIDQSHFTKMIIRKFCPEDAPYGMPQFQSSPAPLNYQAKKNKIPLKEQKLITDSKYPNLSYISAVCTILYLALGTRSDITWIVMKLAKSCINPREEDYKALLHLLGYLRKYPYYAIKYYSDTTESPVYQI